MSPTRLRRSYDEERRARTFRAQRLGLSLARFAIGFSAVAALAFLVWPVLPRRYASTATVVLLMDRDDGTGTARQSRAYPDDNVAQSEVDLISSSRLAALVVGRNGLLSDPEFSRGHGPLSALRDRFPWFAETFPAAPIGAEAIRLALEDRLSVVRDRRSYTVKFGYWSSDPAKAAALTASLLAAFVEARAAHRRDVADGIEGWLGRKVAVQEAAHAASRQRVDRFLEDTGLIDVGAQASLESELSALSVNLANAATRSFETRAKVDALVVLRARGQLDAAPDVLASPLVQRLREQLSARAGLPGPSAPQDVEAAGRIRAESERFLVGAQTEAAEAKARETSLRGEVSRVRETLAARARDRNRLTSLERDERADGVVLEESLVRLKASATLGSASVPEIEVVAEPDAPLKPRFPNPLMAFGGTLVAAVASGSALVVAGRRRRPARRPATEGSLLPDGLLEGSET